MHNRPSTAAEVLGIVEKRIKPKLSIRVPSVPPARTGKLFPLATVEVDIDGVHIADQWHPLLHLADSLGTRADLPQFRAHNRAL